MRLSYATLGLAFLVAAQEAGAADPPSFDSVVAPILARRCLDCHSGATPKGELDLSRKASAFRGGDSGAAVTPGRLDESLMWEFVSDGSMPPKHPLPEHEKQVLRDWIAGGAKWGTDPIDVFRVTTERRAGRDWWSLQPVQRMELPVVRDEGSLRNPIDRFIVRRLEAKGWSLSPEVGRLVAIRRLSYDLLGLPPAPEDVQTFLNDNRPDAYERLVDRYLASPQYGVRWAHRWLDLARYGESNGFEHDEFRPNAWPYRDWVVNALNRDLPYDEFARLQLAGNVLFPNDPESIEATGFLVAGAYDSVGQGQLSVAMRRVVRQDEMEDIVSTVSQTFLGLTAHCARCHDHKFDPIRQEEYYRLCASLAGVKHGERELSPLDPEINALRRREEDLRSRLSALELPIRRKLLGNREGLSEIAPDPIARWDFDRDERDNQGKANASLHGGARRTPAGLKVGESNGFAATTPLDRDLRAKTLEAWVQLDNLEQRGGGVISIENTDGGVFDAIVFGENEPGRWMAGSEGFVRTRPFSVDEGESIAAGRPVHIAITYAEDGTISGYREGKPYGRPYKTIAPPLFRAGKAQVLFGLRHGEPGGNRLLAGSILRCRVYDRVLSEAEIAASAALSGEGVSDSAIVAELSPEDYEKRVQLRRELNEVRESLGSRKRSAYAVSPSPSEPTRFLDRGDTSKPRNIVSAGGIASLSGLPSEFSLATDAPEAQRRIALSQWITDRRNPLFARVIVNRLWQEHFGAGLIEMPSDFGFNGGHPSHPDLLDWLASELIERGWSLKAIHRLIVTSATYRQSSAPRVERTREDVANRLLWRQSPHRLEAETVRDAMLDISGVLDRRLGGPGFREFEVIKARGTISHQYPMIESPGAETFRRTLYRTWARGGRNGFLDAFDCPDPSTTSPKRPVTTTPLQALALLNNRLVLDLSDRFAERLRRDAGPNTGQQVERAYQLAFGRLPDNSERSAAIRVANQHGIATLARAIFNSNEFLYID